MKNVRKDCSLRLKELLFTGLYSGYSPLAPGTVGTLVGMMVFFLEYSLFGDNCWIVNAIVVCLMIYPSIKLADEGERFFGVKDPPQVVLDECMGYWISMLFYPFSVEIAVIAFILFRIMDILKPFPAKQLQELKGGTGIMIDDYIAGIYTNLVILVIIIATKAFEYPIYINN